MSHAADNMARNCNLDSICCKVEIDLRSCRLDRRLPWNQSAVRWCCRHRWRWLLLLLGPEPACCPSLWRRRGSPLPQGFARCWWPPALPLTGEWSWRGCQPPGSEQSRTLVMTRRLTIPWSFISCAIRKTIDLPTCWPRGSPCLLLGCHRDHVTALHCDKLVCCCGSRLLLAGYCRNHLLLLLLMLSWNFPWLLLDDHLHRDRRIWKF